MNLLCIVPNKTIELQLLEMCLVDSFCYRNFNNITKPRFSSNSPCLRLGMTISNLIGTSQNGFNSP